VYSGKKAGEIGSQLYGFVDHYRRGKYMDAPAQSLFIYQLMTAAMSRSINKAPNEDPIEITVKYIRENVGKAISLDQLADMACLSKYHFSRLFKKETGYSPMEFVIGTRLDRAKIMLRTSNKTISEIATEVGYDNPGSFITLFSKKVGQSPNTFRKN
jgi:AraC family transcriptional regulator